MRTATIHRVIAACNLPHQAPEQIKFGDGVSAALNGNPNFPLPNPVIAAFDAALAKYSAAETLALTRAKGTVPARNAARVAFVGALHAVRAVVQQVADSSPEQAEPIITGAGFAVKKTVIRQKQTFVVRNGPTSGTVEVIAKAAAHRAAYEWQYSLDGAKTWVDVPNTLKARTTITGLPAVTNVEFRYRVTTKAGMSDWSQPTSILVK